MDTDEFEIKATGPEGERIWTRSTYDVAKYIADSTITKLGYTKAQVVNTFGGHRSDVLYEVMGANKSVTHSRDAVAEERTIDGPLEGQTHYYHSGNDTGPW